jgi:hypothetical protein
MAKGKAGGAAPSAQTGWNRCSRPCGAREQVPSVAARSTASICQRPQDGWQMATDEPASWRGQVPLLGKTDGRGQSRRCRAIGANRLEQMLTAMRSARAGAISCGTLDGLDLPAAAHPRSRHACPRPAKCSPQAACMGWEHVPEARTAVHLPCSWRHELCARGACMRARQPAAGGRVAWCPMLWGSTREVEWGLGHGVLLSGENVREGGRLPADELSCGAHATRSLTVNSPGARRRGRGQGALHGSARPSSQ